jgi:hypothetical protein
VRSLDYLIADGTVRAKRKGGRVLVPHSELVRFADDVDPIALIPNRTPTAAA